MNNDSAFDVQESFKSLNGGIEMCLSRIANKLAEHGKLEILQHLDADIVRTQDPCEKADYYQLSIGLRNLDGNSLEKAIKEAEAPYKCMQDIQVRFDQCSEDLEASNSRWHAAAESAKLKIEAWGNWAFSTNIACNTKEPFGSDVISSIFPESLKYKSILSVLDSPKLFELNLRFFKDVVGTIQAKIVEGYRTQNLPEFLDRPAFDKAVENLEILFKQHKSLSHKEKEVQQELVLAEARYAYAKKPLVDLLAQMADTTQWALFRCYRPELRKQALT